MTGWNFVYTYDKPKDITTLYVYVQKPWDVNADPVVVGSLRLVTSKGGQFHTKDPDVKPTEIKIGPWVTVNDNIEPWQYFIDLIWPNPTRSFLKTITPGSYVEYKFELLPKQAGTYKIEAYIPYYRNLVVPPPVEPPPAVGDISIKRAHYYLKSKIDGKTYLVNMNGATATGKADYYQLKDSNKKLIESTADLTPVAVPPSDIIIADYAKARRNFANWYQFYRSRADAGIGALGQFLDKLSGVYFRLDGFPPASFGFPIQPINVLLNGVKYDETNQVLANLYSLQAPSAETVGKLHSAYARTGEFFKNTNKNANLGKEHASFSLYSSSADFPYFTKENGGECQQAFAILVTGGFWTTKANELTLADMAKLYWDTDLRHPSLDNFVPINDMDDNTRQHLVTFGISFGVDGEFIPSEWPGCNLPGGFVCPLWPPTVLSQSNETIDDLWHATVEGRGQFINASNPQEMVEALEVIRADIERRLGSAAAVSTNSVQRQTGTHLYQGRYDSNFWSGELFAMPIDVTTGRVLDEIWSARDQLEDKDWDQRAIFTFNGTNGIPFLYNSLTAAQKAQLDPVDPVRAAKMVDYLSGDRELELQAPDGLFRNRVCKLGDIVHSEPVYQDGVVYVGANDGMLHAFAADDDIFTDVAGGEELFAYIPNLVFDHLAELALPAYDHLYYVNNTPYTKTIGGGVTLLVGGLSKGGKGYYCLDITNPEAFSANDVKWEYSAEVENDKDLGYSFSRAFIVNTKAAGWVVVFGNGYNSANGEAVLYVLNATTGVKIAKIPTGVFGCNGIVANVAIIDPNSDRYADYVYAGDLKGNMWKFDISGDLIDDWGVAFMAGGTPKPLFSAKNAAGQAQTITAMADVMRHCNLDRHGYMVIFGTGQYVNEADFDTTDTQTLYGVWDMQPAWKYLGVDPKGKYLGEFTADRKLSNPEWAGDTLLQQSGYFITYNGEKYFIMSGNEIDYWNIDGSGEHLGWYFDLPVSGQRVIRDPMIRDGVVVFIGTTPVQTPCSSGGTSVLYQTDACTGGATSKPVFDINDTGKVDSADVIFIDEEGVIPSGIIIDAMLYKPVDIKDRLYISDDSADINEVVVRPALGGMTYWRETDIRR